jgi:hypothetical protein
MYWTVQGNLGLKVSDQKMKIVTQVGGGGQKRAKKVSRIIWMVPYIIRTTHNFSFLS